MLKNELRIHLYQILILLILSVRFIHLEHFLLFYRIFFYTYGSSLLSFTIYKYFKTKNQIIGCFLFLWASMTATAAIYVIIYYYIMNFDNLIYSDLLLFLEYLCISLISISLPIFMHKIFNINSSFIIKILVTISVVFMTLRLIPQLHEFVNNRSYLYMITIVISNIYSIIIATKNIISLKNTKNRRTGIVFLLSFVFHFIMLFIFDISNIIPYSGFLYFPILYIWVGGFFTIVEYNKFIKVEVKQNLFPKGFVQKYKLTKREVEIAILLAKGKTYKEIAEELFISANTVNSHVKHIYEKTKTNNKTQLSNELALFNS